MCASKQFAAIVLGNKTPLQRPQVLNFQCQNLSCDYISIGIVYYCLLCYFLFVNSICKIVSQKMSIKLNEHICVYKGFDWGYIGSGDYTGTVISR